MTALVPSKITFYARVGDTEVLNQLGVVDMQVEVEPITAENRLETDAPEATMRVVGVDLPGALHELADQIMAAAS